MNSLAHIDLLNLDRWAAEGPPFDWFAQLRAEAPIWRHPSPDGGPGFWVVSRHADVVALGRCPKALSSDAKYGGITGLGPGDELDEVFNSASEILDESKSSSDAKMLLSMDPPEHTAFRRILSQSFTPRSIRTLESSVRDRAVDLLDRHTDGQGFDFTTEVAMPLPMQVIGDLIGAPRDTHLDMLRWSNAVVGGTDPEYLSEGGGRIDAAVRLADLFAELRKEREERPATDLVSTLVSARIDGRPLTDMGYTMYMLLLATAGNETTRNAMSHGLLAFAQHPEQWQRLREDPTLLGSAVEEILRWSSPLLYFRRNAIQEITIDATVVEPGDIVSLWYVSANRDESVFENPEVFDISRYPNRQVAFGGGGVHLCLGASLARIELEVLFGVLLERASKVTLTADPNRLRSNFLNGIKHLPVRLHS